MMKAESCIIKSSIVMNFYEGKEYMKYLGNEEIDDPERLEQINILIG